MYESRDILQEAIELAHLGLAELNADEIFVSMTTAYCSMLDMQESELLGQHWHVSVHPDDRAVTQEAYRLARTTGRGYVEIRALRHDSTVVYQALTVTGLSDENGAFRGYHCLRHDISGYKRDQEALALAVESAPNGLLVLNTLGQIQSVNRAVETLFGYSRGELAGCEVEKLLPERFRVRHLAHRHGFSTSKDMKAMAGRDLCGLTKTGVEIPLQVYLNRIDTDTGELILCTIIDIAERVVYQQALEVAKKAAESANRAKSDFLARMSHEIRTPMNLMMGMNSLLLESELSGKQRQHVEISDRNVRRLLRLVNGILDLSKVEAGMLTLQALPFDLNEIINECTATMSAAVDAKGLQFETVIDPDVWPYWIGDAERVQQVLLNLIGNSVKFTARGKIEVRVRSESFGQGERGLRFEVTDTGCGIPREKNMVIFEAFQQAEESMNRPYEGTGLGLSIAKTLVEMMGGRIWVEEKEGSGAKFAFTAFFPLARKEEVRDKAGAAISAEKGQVLKPGTRILVVEDNPENMILMRAYLDNLSLSLHFASNGVEAVRKRQKANYDLVLMDVQMPIMDGYTATREIRAWEQAHSMARTPIVALTAHALSGAAAESMEAGCDAHLTKPVERNDLVAAIAKFANCSGALKEAIPAPIAARRPAFLANRRLDVVKMKEALENRDFASIQVIGHNCRGIGKGYGFPDISSAGAALEIAALAQNLVEVEKCILRFERCVPVESADIVHSPVAACPMHFVK
jgi:PAS domain S-box-containing protein